MSKIRLDRVSSSFAVQLFEYIKKLNLGSSENSENPLDDKKSDDLSPGKFQFLRYHQNVVRTYINDVDVNSRGLLVYHEMGTGKSWVAAAIGMDQIECDRHPIILLTKSLQANLRNTLFEYVKIRSKYDPDYELSKLSDSAIRQFIDEKFSFVSMNASNMMTQMVRAAEGTTGHEYSKAMADIGLLEQRLEVIIASGSLDNKILIVDEAHNLFRAITNGSKNAKQLYTMVMRAKNLKVIFLTGTPISNDPFEIVPCMNMLAGGSTPLLPENWSDFYKYFVDEKRGTIKNKEKLQNRIMGLVSHISRDSKPGKGTGIKAESTSAIYPEVKPRKIMFIPMEGEQYAIYQLARDKEIEESKRVWRSSSIPSLEKPKNQASSSYRQQSRQLSNYCPPKKFREGKFSSIDIDKIPEEDVDSVKLQMLDKVVNEMPGIGYVYSQFVGAGGLGIIMRYLKKKGWGLSEFQNEETVFKEIAEEEKLEVGNSIDNINTGESAEESVSNIQAVKSAVKPSVDSLVKKIVEGSFESNWWSDDIDSISNISGINDTTNILVTPNIIEPAPSETTVLGGSDADIYDEVIGGFLSEAQKSIQVQKSHNNDLQIQDLIEGSGSLKTRKLKRSDEQQIISMYKKVTGDDLDMNLISYDDSYALADGGNVVGYALVSKNNNQKNNTITIYALHIDDNNSDFDYDEITQSLALSTLLSRGYKHVRAKDLGDKVKLPKLKLGGSYVYTINDAVYGSSDNNSNNDSNNNSNNDTIKTKFNITYSELTADNVKSVLDKSKLSLEQITDILVNGFGIIMKNKDQIVAYAVVSIVDNDVVIEELWSEKSVYGTKLKRHVLSKLKENGHTSVLFSSYDCEENTSDHKLISVSNRRKLYHISLKDKPAKWGSGELEFDMNELILPDDITAGGTNLIQQFSQLSEKHLDWPYILLQINNDNNIGYILLEITDDNIGVTFDGHSELTLKRILSNLQATARANNRSLTIDIKSDNNELRDYLITNGFINTNLTNNINKMLYDGEHERKPFTGGGDARAKRKFAIISGVIKPEVRENIIKAVTSKKNMHGGLIDLLLISVTGAEGLDLKNQRYGVAFEPYWVFARLKQVDARGARANSHIALPKSEQNFQPILFIAVKPTSETSTVDYDKLVSEAIKSGNPSAISAYYTTDLELFCDSMKNEALINAFTQALKEVSIECMVNDESYCRVCAPNNQRLFTNNIDNDIMMDDPCSKFEEKIVKANEIIVNGNTYYYTEDKSSVSGFRIYEFDRDINSYVQMPEDSAMFDELLEKITMN